MFFLVIILINTISKVINYYIPNYLRPESFTKNILKKFNKKLRFCRSVNNLVIRKSLNMLKEKKKSLYQEK